MTTRSDPYAIPYLKPASSSYAWQRGALTFVLTLVALLVFSASFAVGYARVHEGRVLPGVDVAGVSLAGLDRAQAQTKLRQSLPDVSSGRLVINIGSQQHDVAYSSFERDYDLASMLDQAMGVGRGPNLIEQLQEQLRILVNGVSVQPSVKWDSDRLIQQVAAIAQAAQRDPVSATLRRGADGHYQVTPASEGLSVDVAGAVSDAVAAVNNTSSADTSIAVHTSSVPPAISTQQAQAAADTYERVVGSSLTISGAELSTQISPEVLRGWVHLDEASVGNWQVVIEQDPIRQFVAGYALQTDIAPTNATFGFVGTDVEVVPSKDGRAADVDATSANVLAALEARVTGGSTTPTDQATLALSSVSPQFTTDDARAIAGKVTKLSEWTTKYVPSPLNGNGVNIQIPTKIIDGYVVEPGALFDYLAVIGPITSPPYTAGAAIVHGHTVQDGVLGGGMCSSSTTLFNAAARAGLDIRARRNHTYYISRYPVGLDATVWIASASSRQTMSFINDTQYPILVRGINKQGEVTFELYGVPDGRTVEFSDPVVENAQEAQDYYVYTDELAPGQQNRIEYAVDGFDSTVTRTVRDASGNVIHQDTFKSHYKTIQGEVSVGRYPGDPPADTKVLASQWKATH